MVSVIRYNYYSLPAFQLPYIQSLYLCSDSSVQWQSYFKNSNSTWFTACTTSNWNWWLRLKLQIDAWNTKFMENKSYYKQVLVKIAVCIHPSDFSAKSCFPMHVYLCLTVQIIFVCIQNLQMLRSEKSDLVFRAGFWADRT